MIDISHINKFITHLLLVLGMMVMLPDNTNAQNLCADNCDIINLACNNSVNVSVNEDCYAAVTTDLILEDPPFEYCPDSPTYYDIVLRDEDGQYIPGHIVGQEHVGQSLKVTITLKPCGISCWGYINVEDKTGLKIRNCRDGFLEPVVLDCEEYGDGIGPDYPEVSGFCDPLNSHLVFEDDTSNVMCNNGYALSILRTWVATDEMGFRDVCQQEIFVEKFDLGDVEFPEDYITEYTDDCDIFNDISPEVTGYPTGVFCPNMKFYYNDIVYDQCGVQRKLLRDWFVLEWCTGEAWSQGQIIKIIDNSSPIVECPADTVLYPQDWYHCITDVVLDPYGYDSLTKIKVAEECSLPLNVTVEYHIPPSGFPHPFGGPASYFPVEMHEDSTFIVPGVEESVWIRYCYSDDCGNRSPLVETIPELIDSNLTSACCYFEIHIDDQEQPTAICEGYTKVQLTSTGETEILAEVFDDSSFDPCGDIDYFEVKRENSSCPGYNEHGVKDWGPSVHFCCQDLGETVTVRMRAYDLSGNYGECLGAVQVRSHATPKITCTDDVEIDCGDDYTDRDIIGVPEAENGCDSGINIGQDWFDIQDYDLSCGTGTIIRTVDLTADDGTLLKTCMQEIFIDPDNNDEMLEPGDFIFPVDITIDECAFGTNIHPDFTGKPVATKLFECTNIAISYQDEAPLVSNTNGVCYTVLRTWQIVDWCRYDPYYPHQSSITEIQEISISNSSVAEFSCPQDITVNSNSPACEEFVNLEVFVSNTCPSSMTISWEIDAYKNGTIDIVGNGRDASDVYPVGSHRITYYAVNHCGGTQTSCSFDFTIIGNKPPTPICRSELIWTIGFNQQTVVWASDFDLKSIGGCDDLDYLLFSFVSPEDDLNYPETSRVFSCDDIPDGISESIELEVFVIDEANQYAACSVILNLQDSQDLCPDQSNVGMIAGEVLTEMNEPIQDVMIQMSGLEDVGTGMQMTSEIGSYAFENVAYGQYHIEPYSNHDPLAGVSTLDLLLIQKHVLGQQLLETPYKLIAADIDKNGTISAIDLIQLRKLILGIYEEFPDNDSWTFIPERHVFNDPQAPWDYPNYLDLMDMNGSEMEVDFVGVKIGDVNNSIEMESRNASEEHESNAIFLSTENVDFRKGDLVSVPIRLEKSTDLLGMQFTISFDESALMFEGIDRGMLDIGQEDFALLNTHEGTITVSISSIEGLSLNENDVLFTAYFESKIESDLSKVFDVTSDFLTSEIYGLDNSIEKLDMVIHGAGDSEYEQLEVFQNEPNPFDDHTSIAFSIPKKQKVALSVFDSNGSLISYKADFFEKGINEFKINADELSVNGVLFYRIESQSAIVTRKMIVVK